MSNERNAFDDFVYGSQEEADEVMNRIAKEGGARIVCKAIAAFSSMPREDQQCLTNVAGSVVDDTVEPDDAQAALNTMVEWLWPQPACDLATGEPVE